MKIIFDGNFLSKLNKKDSQRAGIFFVVYNVFCEMISRKDVDLIIYANAQNYYDVKKALEERYPQREFNFLFEELRWYRLFARINTYFSRLAQKNKRLELFRDGITYFTYFFLNMSFKARNELKHYEWFVSLEKLPPRVILANKRLRKAVFVHDLIPYMYPQYFPSMKRVWPKFYLKQIVENANDDFTYFTNSESTKKDFLLYTEGRVQSSSVYVTYLASSFEFRGGSSEYLYEKYSIDKKYKYIFSLCTLEPRKNLIRIVESFVQFVNEYKIKDLIMIIGGGKWDSFAAIFDKKMNSADWKKYVKYIGYVDDEDLSGLYSNAEWFVYTSQYEGFGMPVLEAMSCGCPVIASNTSSLPEVVGDAGILINWDSTEEHIRAYHRLYEDSSLRETLSKKGMSRANLFSWKKTTDCMLEAIKKNTNVEIEGMKYTSCRMECKQKQKK